MVWTESLPGIGVIVGALAASGFVMHTVQKLFHKGHTRRYFVDEWDRQMMKRDERITGSVDIQSDAPRYT
eukprot:m.27864 g.27864  ORF g.27864 m.27864 type:complete len:70 (+) comp10161_c0_seq2:65-274(+)